MTRRLCSGRRLLVDALRSVIDASPGRRARGPDGHRRLRELGIVECPDPNEDQVRPRLGLAEHRSAAVRAEPAVHPIAAVGHARIVGRRSLDLEGLGAKARPHRSAARAQVLAIAAPAHPRGDRRFIALPTYRTTETTTGNAHAALGNPRVVLGEEPWLAHTHGEQWREYARRVPRRFR